MDQLKEIVKVYKVTQGYYSPEPQIHVADAVKVTAKQVVLADYYPGFRSKCLSISEVEFSATAAWDRFIREKQKELKELQEKAQEIQASIEFAKKTLG